MYLSRFKGNLQTGQLPYVIILTDDLRAQMAWDQSAKFPTEINM